MTQIASPPPQGGGRLFANPKILPAIILPAALLEMGDRTTDGDLVLAVRIPWLEILERFRRDPSSIHEIDWRMWEEIIAGAYKEYGFDVELTPRSADHGRDIIARKAGVISVRIFDQVKAYQPGTIVRANDVRAMLGVIGGHPNVSKGVITTTSTFAPGLMNDPAIANAVPYRLEPRDRDTLLPWLFATQMRFDLHVHLFEDREAMKKLEAAIVAALGWTTRRAFHVAFMLHGPTRGARDGPGSASTQQER